MLKPSIPVSKNKANVQVDKLHHLAFDNSSQASIITIAKTGKIILANNAACKIFGFGKRDLLTKTRSDIFDIKESSFKRMLKERTAEGESKALITGIKKNGKSFPCEITSAVFMDDDGIKKAITTITDRSQSILEQKNIDAKKEQIVAKNISIAKSDQIVIDIENKKIVADNISIAKLRQVVIDTEKEKIVSSNIEIAQIKADVRLAENNDWIKYIAKTSYDVMWDWHLASDRIYVGDSVKEVFGYEVTDNTVNFADFTDKLFPGERVAVEKKLWQIIKSNKKIWNDSFLFRRNDGSAANVIGRAGIVRDEKGIAIRLIGNIQDISKLHELENKLSEQYTLRKDQTDLFQMAAKLSFDGIWDWNILTNEFILGEGFEELFGYKVNKKAAFDWINHVHPEDKAIVEKSFADAIGSSAAIWEQAFRFTRADGSVARVIGKASIVREEDGTAHRMVGLIHDLSRQNELEEKLEQEIAVKVKLLTEYEENFRLIFNSSADVLYDVDLINDEIQLSLSFEKEFGYKINNKMTPARDWIMHIHPEDRESVLNDYARMIASEETEWKYNYRFIRADNSVANILSHAIIQRSEAGQACRMIISMHDISKQVVLEERLEQEIKLKKQQIAAASEEARETERSDIGKELHDNINQLLGASRLYLELAKRGGENKEMYLSRSSEYTLMAIEEIRILTKGLTSDIVKELGLVDAIKTVIHDMMEVNPVKIHCSIKGFKEAGVNEKFKVNVFRIVQEQLNNIIKHSKGTEVIITVLQNKKNILLGISDNGVGFDTGKHRDGIGLNNIKSRATAFNGVAGFVSQPGKGCSLNISFPVSEKLLK
ncbi:MAG: domain S-box protein [Ferruginibacter sp.]|nr:domain S-box protein [Ferruginibacter sp.]